MNRGWVAWSVALLDVVILLLLVIATKLPIHAAVLLLVGVTSYTAVGALLLSRVPGNAVGALLSSIGTLVVLNGALRIYGERGLELVPSWPGAALALAVADAMFIIPLTLGVVGVPLVFPDGRLPSPRYRWVVALMVAALVSWIIGASTGLQLDLVVVFALPVAFVGGSVATINRFRRGGPVQRAQIKWLASIVVVAAVTTLTGLFVNNVQPDLSSALLMVAVLTLAAMPAAIGIAILRYRLFEIDRIVSRTIGWALVTATLVTVFATLVIGLQAILVGVTQSESQTVIVAASTLLALALFQPVRHRIQDSVDRRFDRARYDGERTTAAFADRLRSQVDLDSLVADLTATVGAAVRPTDASLWLANADRSPIHRP